jgi:hypothetical protein
MYDAGTRVFSPARDEAAAAAMMAHNALTLRTLRAHVESLVTAVSAREPFAASRPALDRLVDWCREQLVPHARAEESTLYRAVASTEQGELLIGGMLEEHRTIYRLVDSLAHVGDPVRAVALAGALEAVVAGHLAKEDAQLLPLLVRSPYIALAEALDGIEYLVGTPALQATA